jgi:hypothetical protein
MFGTLQDRLPKELKLAGIYAIEAANRFRNVYLPAHNARFAKPPQIAESGFVGADAAMLASCAWRSSAWWDATTPSPRTPALATAGEPAAGPLREGLCQGAGVSGRIRTGHWRCSTGRGGSRATTPRGRSFSSTA